MLKVYTHNVSRYWTRNNVTQNQSVDGSSPIKGSHCFFEQET